MVITLRKNYFQHIEFEQPLFPEVDLKRFNIEKVE